MPEMPQHSIFIVDDDQDDRETICEAFRQSNLQINYVFMHSGDQLMGHFAAQPPHEHPSLILLDLNMPGMNGQDVLKEMKSNELLRPIPVIVVTTSSSPKDRAASYRLGANCFITKPDSYQELVLLTSSIAKLWL